jgi:hypothetical protein
MPYEHSPVVSGVIGGLVAMGLAWIWSGWLPKGQNGKSAETLKFQYRTEVWLANAATGAGILGALAMYFWGGYASDDWRPIALGFGFAFSAPLAVLPIVASFRGGKANEAFTAYALAQKTPPVLLFPLLALGIPALLFAAIKW